MANFNKELVQKATAAVNAHFGEDKMQIGEQALVVFDDSSLLYTMESRNGEKHLKIEINLDKPIVIEGELFKVE
ncbi:hypothetical protein vBBceSLY1_00052 [Bacillus phage vB_BceS_LY1]|uniref:Uncharacterized protein n=1 Tax=Bacillus phage vB_BceS_LY1 TaxID=2950459 RepID=A0AAE9S1R2_9CAUD|nr:hypothetical protein vBBceSLY1_00052 [Bacillus phage vB_BceS_LY1]